jgi:hypothetical protein
MLAEGARKGGSISAEFDVQELLYCPKQTPNLYAMEEDSL